MSYYTKLDLQPIDVMDYLHPALANAFKYLDRAGKKPDNPYDQDLHKAVDYINHYFDVKHLFKEDPRAFAILSFYVTKSANSGSLINTYMVKANSVEDFFENARESIQEYFNNQMEMDEDSEMINVMARLMHKKLPYPDRECPVKRYKDHINMLTEDEDNEYHQEKRDASPVQQEQDS